MTPAPFCRFRLLIISFVSCGQMWNANSVTAKAPYIIINRKCYLCILSYFHYSFQLYRPYRLADTFKLQRSLILMNLAETQQNSFSYLGMNMFRPFTEYSTFCSSKYRSVYLSRQSGLNFLPSQLT